MASQPEVTVIIPNYNGRKLLENCIQTLERQTCTDFKLLVVDNGSDDGSTEVTSSLPAYPADGGKHRGSARHQHGSGQCQGDHGGGTWLHRNGGRDFLTGDLRAFQFL